MNPTRTIHRVLFATLALALSACAAPSAASHVTVLAQHHHGGGSGGSGSGGTTCNQDVDCHIPVPRPRACPGGGQSVATACCRMNYCGVCWSDCPPAGGRSTGAADDAPLYSM